MATTASAGVQQQQQQHHDAATAALISSSVMAPPAGRLNWYVSAAGKAALPRILDAVKRLVGEHKILRSQGSGNLELTFDKWMTQPQARLVLPWDFPSRPAVLFINGTSLPKPIVLTSFNTDGEIAEFAQCVTRTRARHAYTAVIASPSTSSPTLTPITPVAVAARPMATPSPRAPIPVTAESKRGSISASELYLHALRMVCVDGKISPDEDERLSALRRQYAISDHEHKEVLTRLAMNEEDYERMRKDGRMAERAKRECVICLDLESDHMVEECGHLCLCANCAPRFPPGEKCPKCRAIVVRVKRVYL